jgi:DnaK suppressor protein
MNVYSQKELHDFRDVILKKLSHAQHEYYNVALNMDDSHTMNADPAWFYNGTPFIEEMYNRKLRLKQTIDDLVAALWRVDNGTYGICAKTGVTIPKEQLFAKPQSTTLLYEDEFGE